MTQTIQATTPVVATCTSESLLQDGLRLELSPDPAQFGKRRIDRRHEPVESLLVELIARNIVDRRGEYLNGSRQLPGHHGWLEIAQYALAIRRDTQGRKQTRKSY